MPKTLSTKKTRTNEIPDNILPDRLPRRGPRHRKAPAALAGRQPGAAARQAEGPPRGAARQPELHRAARRGRRRRTGMNRQSKRTWKRNNPTCTRRYSSSRAR